MHLHTLFPESQKDPELRPEHELEDPHLQAPLPLLAALSQVSGDVQAAREAVHLQAPLPLFAALSQYAPVVRPVQEANEDVHLQTLLAESQ